MIRSKKIYLMLRVAALCLAPVCAHLYLECTLTLLLSIYILSHYSQNPPELMGSAQTVRVSTCREGGRPPSEISQLSQHGPDGDVSTVSSHQRHLLLISESQI